MLALGPEGRTNVVERHRANLLAQFLIDLRNFPLHGLLAALANEVVDHLDDLLADVMSELETVDDHLLLDLAGTRFDHRDRLACGSDHQI